MIFARRALQSHLNYLRSTLPAEVVDAWAARLNEAGRDRMAAMWEVVVAQALAKIGRITVEETLSSGRRPDIQFEGVLRFTADVATVSDEGLDEDNPFSLLLHEIQKAKKKLGLPSGGDDLSVYPGEVVTRRGRKRVLRLPHKGRIRDLVRERVVPALKVQMEASEERLLHVVIDDEDAGFTVTIDRQGSQYSGGSYAAYTAPTIPDDNPLYRALHRKAKQLRGAEGITGVIVGDGSSATLSRESFGRTAVSAAKIVDEFLRQHRSVNFVVLLSVHEAPQFLGGYEPAVRRVEARMFAQSGDPAAEGLAEIFKTMVGHMPRPAMSAVNGALRAREVEYHSGHHGDGEMSGSRIRMSARELVEVLAGLRTLADGGAKYVDASRALGRVETSDLERAFQRQLMQGRLPADIRVVKGGEDDNDDWIEFVFGPPDAAISPIR